MFIPRGNLTRFLKSCKLNTNPFIHLKRLWLYLSAKNDMTELTATIWLKYHNPIPYSFMSHLKAFWLIPTPSVQIKQPIKSQLLTNSVFGTATLPGNLFKLDYCVRNYVVWSLFTVKMTYTILLWHLMVLTPYTNEKSISLSITQNT